MVPRCARLRLCAIELAKSNQDTFRIGEASMELGQAYRCIGNLDSAKIAYQQALPYFQAINNPTWIHTPGGIMP